MTFRIMTHTESRIGISAFRILPRPDVPPREMESGSATIPTATAQKILPTVRRIRSVHFFIDFTPDRKDQWVTH